MIFHRQVPLVEQTGETSTDGFEGSGSFPRYFFAFSNTPDKYVSLLLVGNHDKPSLSLVGGVAQGTSMLGLYHIWHHHTPHPAAMMKILSRCPSHVSSSPTRDMGGPISVDGHPWLSAHDPLAGPSETPETEPGGNLVDQTHGAQLSNGKQTSSGLMIFGGCEAN